MRQNRAAILIVAAALIVTSGPFASAGIEGRPSEGEPVPVARHDIVDNVVDEPCRPHPPIHIDGDEDFTQEGPSGDGTRTRLASGVTGGQGTPEDPYVIRGWCIAAPSASEATGHAGITLADTSAHVVVRDNIVVGPPSTDRYTVGSVGIWLDGAENVEVRGNQVQGQGGEGVLVSSGSGNAIVANFITDNHGPGLHFDHAPGNVAEGNLIHRNEGNGVAVQGEGNVLRDNSIQHNGLDGVHVYDREVLITGNRVLANEHDGISVWAGDVTIQRNRIEGNGGSGVNGDNGMTLANNTIRDNWAGAMFRGPVKGISVESNVFAENGLALLFDYPYVSEHSGENVIRFNNFVGEGGTALYVEGLDEAPTVTDNWWGDEDGPSGGVESACSDAVADGDGRSIIVSEAAVCLGLWLTEPNPTAGASTS